MNAAEFAQAFALAKELSIPLDHHSDDHLHGCGLPEFQPVSTTIEAVAKLIRWQACPIGYPKGQDGPTWDMEAVNEIREISRRKFQCIGSVRPLKVYVWHGVFPDHTGGLAVAIAPSAMEAQALVKAQFTNEMLDSHELSQFHEGTPHISGVAPEEHELYGFAAHCLGGG